MKHLILVPLALLSLSAISQNTNIKSSSEKNVTNPKEKAQQVNLLERVDPNPGKTTKNQTQSVHKIKTTPIKPKFANSSKETTNHLSPSQPATRTNSKQTLSKIDYKIDNKISTLDNLLNLIEIKEKVNETNSSLKNTSDYSKLTSDINTLRSTFDSYVEKKGIANCSTKEQSYYLAFLKEDGKEKAYLEAIKKTK